MNTTALIEKLRHALDSMVSEHEIVVLCNDALAEYDRLRTHPAEGGQGRDYVLVPREPTEAMVSAGFDVHPCRTGETKVTDAYKAMLAAAPPPQPVAPEVDARDTGDEEIGGRYPFDGMGNKIDHEAGDRTKNFLREIGVAPSQLLPVAPERGEAKAVTTCRICGKSSPRMTVCDSCDESSGPWGGTAVPRDLPNEPESSIHVEKQEPFTYAVVRKDVSPDFFMSLRAAEDAITTSNNRTAKIVNLYATPQPPQPVAPEEATIAYLRTLNVQDFARLVRAASIADPASLFAPERGEAKAVAWQVSYFDKVENAWSDIWVECTETQFNLLSEDHYRGKVLTRKLYATPQPPPPQPVAPEERGEAVAWRSRYTMEAGRLSDWHYVDKFVPVASPSTGYEVEALYTAPPPPDRVQPERVEAVPGDDDFVAPPPSEWSKAGQRRLMEALEAAPPTDATDRVEAVECDYCGGSGFINVLDEDGEPVLDFCDAPAHDTPNDASGVTEAAVQALKDSLWSSWGASRQTTDWPNMQQLRAALEAADRARTAPQSPRFRDPTIEDAWIAVEHELPPRNTDVLVGRYVNNDWRICQSGYYYDRGNEFEGEKPYWYWSSDWDNGSVTDDEGPTHWMPLPKPAALNAIGAKVEE